MLRSLPQPTLAILELWLAQTGRKAAKGQPQLQDRGEDQGIRATPPVQEILSPAARVIARKPSASSSRARRSDPASTACWPPAVITSARADLASASSPAISTVVGRSPTVPDASVAANVVLNALSTRDCGSFAAISAAAELSDGTVSESNVLKSSGLVMSTTILPANWSLRSASTAATAGYGTARMT